MQNTQATVWLRTPDIARELGMSRETARKLVANGSIKAERHGKRGIYRVRAEDFERYRATSTVCP